MLPIMREEAALLQWYIDAGVEDMLQDEPRNYFAPPPAMPAAAAAPVQHQSRPAPAPAAIAARPAMPAPSPLQHAPSAAMEEARALANAATTLEALEAAVRGFEGCAIKRTAHSTVFARGNPKARLMLIGEAPGAQEDLKGVPFCGPSGDLLDKMLAAIGHDESNSYITNSLFWRPPGNRPPSTEELAICRPFVEKHIALLNPALIVLVGGTAIKAVLGLEAGITRLRGKPYTLRTPYGDTEHQATAIYHPSYLLRQPGMKRVTWQDLLAIQAKLAQAA